MTLHYEDPFAIPHAEPGFDPRLTPTAPVGASAATSWLGAESAAATAPVVAAAATVAPAGYDPRVHGAPPATFAPVSAPTVAPAAPLAAPAVEPVVAPVVGPAVKVGTLLATAAGVGCVVAESGGLIQIAYFASVDAPVELSGLTFRVL